MYDDTLKSMCVLCVSLLYRGSITQVSQDGDVSTMVYCSDVRQARTRVSRHPVVLDDVNKTLQSCGITQMVCIS